MPESRLLPVPDGLDGLRLDVALSRLLGLSRTTAAEPHRHRTGDRGRRAARPQREGARRRVARGHAARPAGAVRAATGRRAGGPLRRRRRGRRRQADRRRRASEPGLDRPDRDRRASPRWATASRRAAEPSGRASSTASTPAPPASWRSRSPSAPTPRSSGRSRSARWTSATRRSSRAIPIPPAGRSTRRSTGIPAPTTSSPSSPAGGRASRTTRRSRHSVRRRCSTSTSRPGAPTRSGCTWRRCGIPCVGDLTYGADPVLARRLGLTRQWLHARELGFEHPGTGGVGARRVAAAGRPAARARHPG